MVQNQGRKLGVQSKPVSCIGGEGLRANHAPEELPIVRCRACDKFLFRGWLKGEIKCRNCKEMNRWE